MVKNDGDKIGADDLHLSRPHIEEPTSLVHPDAYKNHDSELASLVPDFNYLQPILSGEKLEDVLKHSYVPPAKKKAIIIPRQKGFLVNAADIQGNLTDFQMLVAEHVKGIMEGNKMVLNFAGDLSDAIPEYDSSGSPVVIHLDDPRVPNLDKLGLLIKDEKEKRALVLAYPEDSLQINAQFSFLRKHGGDSILAEIGDHDLQHIVNGAMASKAGFDQTNSVTKKVNQTGRNTLKETYKELPLLVLTE
ncbi:MAG TPA: hypothetical protein VKE88_02460, partial [Candidatus Nanoarchaeia archaeon]|nr:hypothetical protein [Candidatus Nanoarchaeia archaeon]